MQKRPIEQPSHPQGAFTAWVFLGLFAVDRETGCFDPEQMGAAPSALMLPPQAWGQIQQAVSSHLQSNQQADQPLQLSICLALSDAQRTVQELAAAPAWGLFTVAREILDEDNQMSRLLELFLYSAGGC